MDKAEHRTAGTAGTAALQTPTARIDAAAARGDNGVPGGTGRVRLLDRRTKRQKESR